MSNKTIVSFWSAIAFGTLSIVGVLGELSKSSDPPDGAVLHIAVLSIVIGSSARQLRRHYTTRRENARLEQLYNRDHTT